MLCTHDSFIYQLGKGFVHVSFSMLLADACMPKKHLEIIVFMVEDKFRED